MIFIVILVQVALAQHTPDGRVYQKYGSDHFGPVEMLNVGSDNLEVPDLDKQFGNPEHNGHRSYSDEDYTNEEAKKNHTIDYGSTNYGIHKHEKFKAKINNENNDRRGLYIGVFDRQLKNNNGNTAVNHFEYNQAGNNKGDMLKTNLDYQFNVNIDRTFIRRLEYNVQVTNNFHGKTTEGTVRTNRDLSCNADNKMIFNEPLGTIPRQNNGDTKVIADKYKEKAKEVNKEGKWVWSDISMTEKANRPKMLLSKEQNGLSDRVILEADKCPEGQAKVAKKCIDIHTLNFKKQM